MNKYILTGLFWILVTNCIAQSVSFFQEDLTFKIEGNNFYVNGIYFFRCPQRSDSSRALFYPFPVDTHCSKVDSLTIYNITRGEEITDYKQHDSGVLFYPRFDSLTVILVRYRQQFTGGTVRYILTSTQFWDKALESASYKLITNYGVHIESFSYQPDSYTEFENTIVYYWEKKNFMPMKDMIFTFDN